MKKEIVIVHFTSKFPSVDHPVYAEVRNDENHIIYWDAYRSADEMKDYMAKLFCGKTVKYTDMR